MAIKIHPTAKIHETVVLGMNVTIGANVVIGPYCLIGMPGEHREKSAKDYGVYIGDNTTLTGLVTVDSGVEGITYIGENVYVMKHAHVGHDAIIRNNVTISCGVKIGGHTEIDPFANIGLNAVIHQNHHIAHWAMIGMGAVVPKGVIVRAGFTYVGNPAKCIGQNKKAPVDMFTMFSQNSEV
ncbi:LbetaH domain-containing protein [Chitinophaga cymbidii]|uniref:Acyl-[acyl-carrier-protein]--UDP-N-acetylglucosamine O-acyltransferase n=1 Tax=Chitinophaga cymbidii TaxID=1096750 RepID=A0A512RIM8_9BACT|nr:hypothetical protein [Chitinophaga cymbidii]GEP95553.1 acyl-[acyl-carrier-protein]--UDP-N-acetylglucosamine O-acyltransferase [Chitinophaga cymbidii]